MGGECWLCPEGDPICLEFHHINPDKKSFGLSHSKSGLVKSKEKILLELKNV